MESINHSSSPTRIALGVEYDGQTFLGWQRQKQGQTIQNNLEKALGTIAQERITVHAAGRTDSGVHALQQVIHFDTYAKRPIGAWIRGTNSHLPSNIAIKWAQQVSSDFHARFSALSRCYSYWLLCCPTRPGVLNGKVGWYFQRLDKLAMQKATTMLLGQHDFSCFRSSQCQAKSPIKTLYCLTITPHEDFLHFEFEADAFLHHMVRNIVSALIYVGKGRLTLETFKELLTRKNRLFAPPTFMPDGLYLTGVNYPEHFNLPKRVRGNFFSLKINANNAH